MKKTKIPLHSNSYIINLVKIEEKNILIKLIKSLLHNFKLNIIIYLIIHI
jgi:hypothetical protein